MLGPPQFEYRFLVVWMAHWARDNVQDAVDELTSQGFSIHSITSLGPQGVFMAFQRDRPPTPEEIALITEEMRHTQIIPAPRSELVLDIRQLEEILDILKKRGVIP